MSSVCYARGKALFAGKGDWSSDEQSFAMLLATDSYQPKLSHRSVADVTGELAGGGYARKAIKGRSVVANDEAGRADCFGDAVTYDDLATREAYRWVVIYRNQGKDKDSELICAIDMNRVDLTGIATHTIKWDGKANGRVFSLT